MPSSTCKDLKPVSILCGSFKDTNLDISVLEVSDVSFQLPSEPSFPDDFRIQLNELSLSNKHLILKVQISEEDIFFVYVYFDASGSTDYAVSGFIDSEDILLEYGCLESPTPTVVNL